MMIAHHGITSRWHALDKVPLTVGTIYIVSFMAG